MKAIVIVFMPPRDGEISPAQKTAMQHGTASRSPIDLDRGSKAFPPLTTPDRTPAPFWTWFIENPRRCNV
jgi:hypothetical protein